MYFHKHLLVEVSQSALKMVSVRHGGIVGQSLFRSHTDWFADT